MAEERIVIEALLDKAREEGVHNPSNLPFLLEPKGPVSAGVLLVHGFTASPWEMRAFGEALAGAGYRTLGVRLPGHGTTVADLAGRRWEEWLEAVTEARHLLGTTGEPVFGVGMSTGAVLLLALAARQSVDGLVLLSPFLRLRHRLAPLAGLFSGIWPYQQHPLPPHLGPYYYDRRPLAGVAELGRLLRRLRGQLPSVTAPSLVISALGDTTVDADSAVELFRRLGSPHKEFHCHGPQVPHVLCTGENPRYRQTLAMTLGFLEELLPADEKGP